MAGFIDSAKTFATETVPEVTENSLKKVNDFLETDTGQLLLSSDVKDRQLPLPQIAPGGSTGGPDPALLGLSNTPPRFVEPFRIPRR